MRCFDTKIAIVGAGHVGSTLAYTCMLQGLASQIALIDVDKNRAGGEAMDLNHCQQFVPNSLVVAGDSFELVAGANIVVITAGLAQRQGQSRIDLLCANAALFSKIVPAIIAHNKDCFILVVTNPMDVLSYVTYKLSGFPANRVFGSGTVLDTARLRFLVAKRFGVSPKDVMAYVLGEHGDSEFVWWSGASLAGSLLSAQQKYDKKFEQEMLDHTRQSAYEIIAQKGSTSYAIALTVAKIIKSIMFNQSRVFTVSTLTTDVVPEEVYLSLPVVLRADGNHVRLPVVLSEQEDNALRLSAQQICQGIVDAQKCLNSI